MLTHYFIDSMNLLWPCRADGSRPPMPALLSPIAPPVCTIYWGAESWAKWEARCRASVTERAEYDAQWAVRSWNPWDAEVQNATRITK